MGIFVFLNQGIFDYSMELKQKMRIDKFLWHVRLYKTRSLATRACQAGDVRISGKQIKPSRELHIDSDFQIFCEGGARSFVIKNTAPRRLSASEVKQYICETTTEEEKRKIESSQKSVQYSRDLGFGKLKKRDIRLIEHWMS